MTELDADNVEEPSAPADEGDTEADTEDIEDELVPDDFRDEYVAEHGAPDAVDAALDAELGDGDETEVVQISEAQIEARIHMNDEPLSEDALRQAHREAKEAAAVEEFVQFSRDHRAKQAEQAALAAAPTVAESDAPEPTPFDLMSEDQFQKVLVAREQGLEVFPSSLPDGDVARAYQQFAAPEGDDS